MEYNFKEIEKYWSQYWIKNNTYKVVENKDKEKFYVLDMFPYPSGAGLHVGHPLGYIASDIVARYKTLKGFNVLHPMGFDAYGLPAEQYAIQTGQHPAITTENNIKRYREQLDRIGFSFDWDREFRTSDPQFYKWTQWAFIKMFESFYDKSSDSAKPISELISHFEQYGTNDLDIAQTESLTFTAHDWKSKTEEQRQEILLNYRIAYLADTNVNWCAELGTVLANDEVVNGLSVRGGHPVEQKVMRQWSLRVSAYAERLLNGLDNIEWSESIKETQRNWIGKSTGAEMKFEIKDKDLEITIFTTRPDTVFGVTFMVLAPESDYVKILTSKDQYFEVENYISSTKKRTERDRLADKKVTGVFSGSFAINPMTKEEVPIWISDYVLAGYGTGAIMAVPAHDSRDYTFAKHFGLEIRPLVKDADVSENSFDAKEGIMINSGFLNGLSIAEAIEVTKNKIKDLGLGCVKTNYRLRDAIFSRQRYWGEPFPVYYKNGLPYMLPLDKLPLELPSIDNYQPTEKGEPPLGHAKKWAWNETTQEIEDTNKIDHKSIFPLELNTMPGFAGSSAYYLRYMDPQNNNELVSQDKNEYWQNVDLYIGGTEHATGHLIYSRMWNKFLFDLGCAVENEPFKKLINQGMIQGVTHFVYRINGTNKFVTLSLKDKYETTPIRVDIKLVSNGTLDKDGFKNWLPDFKNAEFITESDCVYVCGSAVEKMSKSYHNVVNPDDVSDNYGADTLRLYEMFLGPLEYSKPWDTNGIDGVHRFLRKMWNLFWDGDKFAVNEKEESKEELKSIHKLIKKITQDIDNFSFNTSISAFMICVNELSTLKCKNKNVLSTLVILMSPFAPFITEELWKLLGNSKSITKASWPNYNEEYLKDDEVHYAISFNGKTRFSLTFPAGMPTTDVETKVLSDPNTQKWIEDKVIKKIIVVKDKIVNIVL